MSANLSAASLRPVFIDLSRQTEGFKDISIASAHAESGRVMIFGTQSIIYTPTPFGSEQDLVTCVVQDSVGKTFHLDFIIEGEDMGVFEQKYCEDHEVAC